MRGSKILPVVSSVGIEIECKNVSRETAQHLLYNQPVQIINDGSVRDYKPTVAGLPFVSMDSNTRAYKLLQGAGVANANKEIGCELVSSIIDTTQKGWENYVLRALDSVHKLGEGIATTTSVHVHVNARGLPIDVIKNLVRLWQSVESGMFRISCGPLGTYRGAMHKDSHYCRPLIKKGPHAQKCLDARYRPCFNVDAISKCNTMGDLEMALGRIDKNNTHYHISRYMALSLHPLFRLGSVEFRTFNFTLSPAHIIAYVEVSKAILRNAMDKYIEEYPLNPYGTSDMHLVDLVNWLRIYDDKLIYTLEDLWSIGEFPPPLAGWRMTHMKRQATQFDWGRIRKELKPSPIPENEKIWDSESLIADDSTGLEGTIKVSTIKDVLKMYCRGE